MIGGTSGSERKFWKPSSSQSKSTQTRSASLGSRKTVAPLDPCSFRFAAPLVEKMFKKREGIDQPSGVRAPSRGLPQDPARGPARASARALGHAAVEFAKSS